MNSEKRDDARELNFKESCEGDRQGAPPPAPLGPRRYLDMIEASMKSLPDVEAALSRSLRNAPKVRFTM